MAQAVATSVFEKAKEEIGYIWNCSKIVEDLEREYTNLDNMKKNVQGQIEAAIVNGERLKFGVQEWLDKAESSLAEAKKIIDEFEANANKTCLNLGMCMDLGTRYRCGKKAANKDHSPYASLTKHQKDGEKFGSGVSFLLTRAPGVLDVYKRHNIVDLDMHKRCFENILEFIQDEDIQITGIYGMGGVGKTTLAKEVALEVKSLNLFAAVEFITVSQPVDVERIRNEAKPAATRIENGEKILVILDDLWGELKLDDLGIPCGDRNKNCKIL